MIITCGCPHPTYPLVFVYQQQKGEKLTLKTDLIETEMSGSFYPFGYIHRPGWDTIWVEVKLDFENINMHGKTFSFDTSQISFICDKSINIHRESFIIRKHESLFHRGLYSNTDKATLKDNEIDEFDIDYGIEFDVAKLKNMGNDTVRCVLKLPMFQDSIHITMIPPK